ncbi:cytochrome c [Chitinophaga ginsengisegetis]|uniref:Cytochrome c n=1 Tax=Chitinophaga ginsengisegetis TaxID=393003 RepID=A0A1T5N3Y1_9BACT|nr:PQQ-dependent sugar dehydrogenase [Chitinophaga ginsengisegetis]SKC95157.1 cytochrome c [Chitinophaga ginsengisegetis]
MSEQFKLCTRKLPAMFIVGLTLIMQGCGDHPTKSKATKAPEDNRFTKTILSNDLNEPMELAVAGNGSVYFIERSGKLYHYDPATQATKVVYTFPVLPDTKEGFGNGLLGVTLDPGFDKNHYIYFYYTPNKLPAAQQVSRFTLEGKDSLVVASEKVLLTIPLELEVSAHTGGSLDWDRNGNLFISTGDNTVPFASNGYAPIDTIPGRITFDAERSAGNTNDLRGKVLRIHPEPDGSYTIPSGNLFPKGTAGTRPEIYAMGCRNPYRMSVDTATGIVYWGEVGPDAGEDSDQGPRGYDEINQAKKPGNFGWPFVVGDNKVYPQYDFATKTIGAPFKAEAPVNNSPNNTGLKVLPPAQKAMIWYPYDSSAVFPQLGNGGRCAMAGPVFHYNEATASPTGLPVWYDNALFIYDWMRNWVYAVRLDSQQNFKSMEPFMKTNGDFRRPVDMAIGKGGDLYILEYGSVYGIDNDDARLVRISYNGGNRAPVAAITTVDTAGTAPMKVNFSSNKSYDFDEGQAMKYEWHFGDETAAVTDSAPVHTYQKNGVYHAILKITDPEGASSTDTITIRVGNTIPEVKISTTDNTTFYFDNSPLHYTVTVTDKEDPAINNEQLMIGLHYIPRSKAKAEKGHQLITTVPAHPGKLLMEGSDCKACHQVDKASVGPAFTQVAKRYEKDPKAPAYLAAKIIKGGGGVWGEHSMAAHPQLSVDEAGQIVKYILTLGTPQAAGSLPASGSVALKDHLGKEKYGAYVLAATYTDGGGNASPLSGSALLLLRSLRVQAEDADSVNNINRSADFLGAIHNKSFFVFRNIDLKGIHKVTYRYSSLDKDAVLEIHTGSVNGPVISKLAYKATGSWDKFIEVTAPVQAPAGNSDLYFVFSKDQQPDQHLFTLDWLEFKP